MLVGFVVFSTIESSLNLFLFQVGWGKWAGIAYIWKSITWPCNNKLPILPNCFTFVVEQGKNCKILLTIQILSLPELLGFIRTVKLWMHKEPQIISPEEDSLLGFIVDCAAKPDHDRIQGICGFKLELRLLRHIEKLITHVKQCVR